MKVSVEIVEMFQLASGTVLGRTPTNVWYRLLTATNGDVLQWKRIAHVMGEDDA